MPLNSNVPRLSNEQLILFQEELAALIRAGVPLEASLRQLRGSTSLSLVEAGEFLSQHLEAGDHFVEALERVWPQLPASQRSLLGAALRTGRLAEVLEQMASDLRLSVEITRRIEIAAFYPLLVTILGYFLLVGLAWGFDPRLHQATTGPLDQPHLVQQISHTVFVWLRGWWWLPPWAWVLGILFWRFVARPAIVSGHNRSLLLPIPGLSGIFWYWRWMQACRTLKLLLDQEVPLHQSVEMMAEMCPTRTARESLRAFVQNNQLVNPSPEPIRGCPGFLAWLLGANMEGPMLRKGLEQAAEIYRMKAELRIIWLRMCLPVVGMFLAVMISMTAFFVMVIGPLVHVYHDALPQEGLLPENPGKPAP